MISQLIMLNAYVTTPKCKNCVNLLNVDNKKNLNNGNFIILSNNIKNQIHLNEGSSIIENGSSKILSLINI